MAGYQTKADFYAAYSVSPTDPITGVSIDKGSRHPSWVGLVDYNPETGLAPSGGFRLHYHPVVFKEAAYRRANMLIAAGLVDASSAVVIVGGAYGWLGTALRDLLPGLRAVSIDTSQYVADTKNLSPDDELIESITAAGYNHLLPNSVGEYLFNAFSDPAPRADIVVMQSALQNNGERNKIRNDIIAAVGRDVSLIITEECWQTMTAQEQSNITAAHTSWGVPLWHFIDGVLTL